MNTSRILIGWLVAFFSLYVAAPASLAQATGYGPLTATVVSNLNPVSPPPTGFVPYGCTFWCAQEFTVGSSGAYVNQLAVIVAAYSGMSAASCTFGLTLTDGLRPASPTEGPGSGMANIYYQGPGQVNLPAGFGSVSLQTVSASFPTVWLPAGNYFVVFDQYGPTYWGTAPCDGAITYGDPYLAWAPSGPGFSPVIGTVGPSFVNAGPSWSAISGTFVFFVGGPIYIPPTGGGLLQMSRLVVEGPITPPAGGPVEAQLGFENLATGALLAPLTTITLTPGTIQSVDLDLTPFATQAGGRVEVQPVILQAPNAAGAPASAPVQISASVQIVDEVTGFGTVLAPAVQPGASVQALGPQVLAGGQDMRVDIVASSSAPCVAQVGFNDNNGNALILPVAVNLAPGAGTSVDLSSKLLGLRVGQRIEALPVVTVSSPASAAPTTSVCNASVEVFDYLTGRTWSHQSTQAGVGLPAVQ